MGNEADVVVVGGGLAGLTAAYRLRQAGAGVVVLEAAGEVGGRTRSRRAGDQIVDFGAEWLGRGHVNLIGLLGELGIQTRSAAQIYYPILWRSPAGGRLLLPKLAARELAAIARAVWRAGRLARTLDCREPWSSPSASRLDQISFGEWLRAYGIREDGYRLFGRVIGALSSTPIEQLSLLHVLWWIRRGGGALGILWTTFERNIPGGAQSIASAIADRLGESVRLDSPVSAIGQTDVGLEVRTVAGESIRGRYAIVTAPFGVLGRIEFDPRLPSELAQLDRLSIDPGTKVTGLLPEGQLPLHRVFVDGRVLAGGWRVGARVTGFAPPPADAAPEAELISDLAEGFGTTAAQLRHTSVYRWSEHPFIPGCDIGFRPGQLTTHGPWLRRAHGRIHFAGAERSSWPNNMEGAAESGILAARQVTARLANQGR